MIASLQKALDWLPRQAVRLAMASLLVAGQTAQPTHLAVWVQGPGSVWVDDLSLREVIPPPVVLKLDDSGRLTLVAPADLGRCRFGFNAAGLAPGSYECRVALLDAEQREIAKRSVPFERNQDPK